MLEYLPLTDVVLIKPRRFEDPRGFFAESWNRKTLTEQGLTLPEFVQDNHSMSNEAGTLRGLHFQTPPHAQGKLVRCGRGAIFDVAVDIRKGSDNYGKWIGRELSFENGHQMWIPPGFAHGFVTLEPNSEIIYKCTAHYAPDCDRALHWDSCGIDWPLGGKSPILSDKDAGAQRFEAFDSPFEAGGTT